MARRDAFASRQRNAGGDYSLDPKAARFPEWQAPADATKEKPKRGASKNSLTGLVEDWWKEAKRVGRLPRNPAEGITLKIGKSRNLRSKGVYDSEAIAILKYARQFVPGREAPKLAAAKRWVPWLCALTGARVDEMIQMRKEDIRREGKLWVLHVTPEAGPVKTDEARDLVLHRQIIE